MLIRAIVCLSVAATSLLGFRANPRWLSLIWTNEKLPAPAPGALAEGAGREDSAADRPHEASARPGHAFQEPATIHPVALVIALALIRHC